ncbi:MAG: hypothetical protein EXS14_02485 [Planctomycetes bacterium]|nr:hypothetical protein [Planctomycetota bacterium]
MHKLPLLFVGALLLAACVTGADSGGPVAVHADASLLITAARGSRFELSLPANAPTGFVWHHEVCAAGKQVEIGKARSLKASSGLLGAAGEERVLVCALETGVVRIRSTYARPWEKGVAPARDVLWTISVTP